MRQGVPGISLYQRSDRYIQKHKTGLTDQIIEGIRKPSISPYQRSDRYIQKYKAGLTDQIIEGIRKPEDQGSFYTNGPTGISRNTRLV